MLAYRLERQNKNGEAWTVVAVSESPFPPASQGFIGARGQSLRWVFATPGVDSCVTEVWAWSERVPVNPADIANSDFVAGWKITHRVNAPTPSSDELGHFFLQGGAMQGGTGATAVATALARPSSLGEPPPRQPHNQRT